MHKCHIHCVHQILCAFTEAPHSLTVTAATPEMEAGIWKGQTFGGKYFSSTPCIHSWKLKYPEYILSIGLQEMKDTYFELIFIYVVYPYGEVY